MKRLAKLSGMLHDPIHQTNAVNILAKAGNRMGTARRCNLARFISTFLHYHASGTWYMRDMIRILTRVVSLYYSINAFLTHQRLHQFLLLTPHTILSQQYCISSSSPISPLKVR